MFCSKCGSKNDDAAIFCGNCGAKLDSAPETVPQSGNAQVSATSTVSGNPLESVEQQSTPASSVQEAPTAQVAQPVAATVAQAPVTAMAVKKGIGGKVVGAVIAVAVIVAVITAFTTGGFGLLGSNIKGSVNEYSWEELSNISEEIAKASDESGAIEIAKKFNLCTQDGKLDGTQTKSIQLSDGTNIDVQIVGFSHDSKTSGGKAGITFIFKDAIAKHGMNSKNTTSGGWEDSDMRSWLASTGMGMLPGDLQSQIVQVDKLTNNTGETENTSFVISTSDKLWLFSTTELCGKINWWSGSDSKYNDILNAEGTEYKLYRDMNVDSEGGNSILVKSFERKSCSWWGRSPLPDGLVSFLGVYGNGDPWNIDGAANSFGVVPGFCI